MSAGKTVRLSDFAPEIGYETVRDASFRHVAKIATRLDRMVVPLIDAAFADALSQARQVPRCSAVFGIPPFRFPAS